MPYLATKDLPDSVKKALPQHAQEIYLIAFNNAWQEYKDPEMRSTNALREETAHKVAWAAVKKKYVKKDNQWKEKEE